MNKNRREDIMVSISGKDADLVDGIFIELFKRLKELKRLGVEPKSRKVTKSIVKSAIFRAGIEILRKMSWEEFDDVCRKGNIYKRRRA